MKKFITLLLLLSDVVTVQAQIAMVLKMKDGTRNIVLGKAPATDAANVDGQRHQHADQHPAREITVHIAKTMGLHTTKKAGLIE